MPAIKLSSVAWASGIAAAWLVMGFAFARMNASPSDPGLAGRAAAALTPGSNRILIVGGSNAIAGIHHKELADAIGRSVLNLSLPASGGDERVLWEYAKAGAKSGDTVILSLRSFLIEQPKDLSLAKANDQVLTAAMKGHYHPTGVVALPWQPLPAESVAQRILELLNGEPSASQKRFSCDAPTGMLDDVPYRSRPEEYWHSLAANVADLQNKKVTVLATMPWLRVPPDQQAGMRKLLAEARARLAAMDVAVVEPDDDAAVVKDGNLSCDGAHLSQDGAAVHTRYLARHLRAKLADRL